MYIIIDIIQIFENHPKIVKVFLKINNNQIEYKFSYTYNQSVIRNICCCVRKQIVQEYSARLKITHNLIKYNWKIKNYENNKIKENKKRDMTFKISCEISLNSSSK